MLPASREPDSLSMSFEVSGFFITTRLLFSQVCSSASGPCRRNTCAGDWPHSTRDTLSKPRRALLAKPRSVQTSQAATLCAMPCSLHLHDSHPCWRAGLLADNPFNTLSLGCDFLRQHALPTIDFATAHLWPDTWLPAGANAAAKLRFARCAEQRPH